MRPKKNVTMSDIADSLHISVVSVSNAYAGKKSVSEALREKIFAEGERLGYTYVSGAGKRERAPYALVCRGLSSEEKSWWFSGLQAALSSGKDQLTQKTEGAAGIFAVGVFPGAELSALSKGETPVLAISPFIPAGNQESVIPDAFDSMQLAVRALSQSQLTPLALVRGEHPACGTAPGLLEEDRVLGYLCAREESDADFFGEPGVYRGAGAFYRAMRELPREQRPAAVLCTDLGLAIEVRRAAADSGIFPVPPQILPCCSEEELSLHLFSSGIVPDRESMVREAVRCMKQLREKGAQGRVHPVQEKLILDGARWQGSDGT
jgi:DNA-binding LacI/PurR family transcriptional regulator